ncbi:DUF948 domain-containing protein [Paenibacillus ehimensis]|uniref:DUF948 domain-containing protein n=1 Tax=Paenibacillus ehimensis TaxID=79264 RepID=A0ABT8VBX1_9BACL|nr:DUF948 domain-containing protein [Paenibacillus ehimensis]MDO3678468.1 DUF948 domain-containing protein [Paenibacillus ehimensis]
MWWQWGAAVCIFAFLVLIGLAIRLAYLAIRALRHAETALDTMQQQVRQTTESTESLLRVSTEVMQDLQGKMQAVDAWFAAAEETGEAVRRVSRIVKAVSLSIESTALEARKALHSHQDTANDLMELTAAGLHLWHRLQASRPMKSEE